MRDVSSGHKESPDMVAQNFYEVSNLFRQKNRSEDLAKALIKCDLKKFRHYYYISNVISELLDADSNSELAIDLLERTLKQYPARANLY